MKSAIWPLLQLCLAVLLAAIAGGPVPAQETLPSGALGATLAGACFTAGQPGGARLDPRSDIVALMLRPRDPQRDGDGSVPPGMTAALPPAEPGDVPLTLTAAYADDLAGGPIWGQRFICAPHDGRFICGVDDWCADVGFELAIDGPDGILLEIKDDAGSIGILGDSCNDAGRALGDEATPSMTFHLTRRPIAICQ